tara:strand:- start:46 stop:390 length:345 start_codon:yes stop_codon:yes gene_type:complete
MTKLDVNNVEYMWFWENDHRKSNRIHVSPKNPASLEGENNFQVEKSSDLTKLIKSKGVRFYTCDDDYEHGDDYRYGYYYNIENPKALDFDPLDMMEGDGHVHMFYKEEGKYKAL